MNLVFSAISYKADVYTTPPDKGARFIDPLNSQRKPDLTI